LDIETTKKEIVIIRTDYYIKKGRPLRNGRLVG